MSVMWLKPSRSRTPSTKASSSSILPRAPPTALAWIGIPSTFVNGVRITPIGRNAIGSTGSVVDREHHLGRLDDRRHLPAGLEAQPACRLRRDRRDDLVTPVDADDDLGDDGTLGDRLDRPGQLVTCADLHGVLRAVPRTSGMRRAVMMAPGSRRWRGSPGRPGLRTTSGMPG